MGRGRDGLPRASGRTCLTVSPGIYTFEPPGPLVETLASLWRCRKRGVAQSGSASALGAEGRRFESGRPDQHQPTVDGETRSMQVRIFKPAKTAMQSGQANTLRMGARAGAVAQGDRPADGLDGIAQHHAAGPAILPDPRRGQGPCREKRLAVHGRAAAQPASETQGLCRQFFPTHASAVGRIERP